MRDSTPQNPVLIIEIAPATSLGEILRKDISIAKNCYCCAMSGSIYRGYGNSSTPSKEYNVEIDIPASQLMYRATWLSPLVTSPVDSGMEMQFFGAPWEVFLLANSSAFPYPYALMAQYEVWYANHGGGGGLKPFDPSIGTSTLWDLQAAFMGGSLKSNKFPFVIIIPTRLDVSNDGFTKVTPGANFVLPALKNVDKGISNTAVATLTSISRG